jgi:hypothetical protein
MRLGIVVGVFAVLVSGCASADAGDGPHGRYPTVDACRLVRDRTVDTLSAGLPKQPPDVTGGPNALPYDLSVCRLQFGAAPAVDTDAPRAANRGPLPVGVPAYRAVTVTAYRYNANSTQSAAYRADILIKSLASGDVITSPDHNLDRVYLSTYDSAGATKAEAWVLAGNVVLDIAYEMANEHGITGAMDEDDGRKGALALVSDAASRLTCASGDNRETC